MDYTRCSQPSSTCWDPNTIFSITNPSTGYATCIGQAVTCGRRCRRRVAWQRVDYAKLIVGQVAELGPNAAAKSSMLHDLAQTMLCYQHGHQKEEIISQWKDDILLCRSAGAFESSKTSKSKSSATPTGQYDNMDDLFEGVKKLQEQMRRMEAMKEAWSRNTWPGNSTSMPFPSPPGSARSRNDPDTNSAGIGEKKEESARERQARETKERAERIKEEARRKAQATKMAEEQEWSNAWTRYNVGWKLIEEGRCRTTRIPWPTLSGKAKDVTEAGVREFFRRAPPAAEDCFRLFTHETKRWHTDKLLSRLGSEVVCGPDKENIDLVTKVMVQRWKEAKLDKTRRQSL